MDCFSTYFTHVQTCDNVRVHSARQWTASVHTLHMSKPLITFVFIVLRLDCFGIQLGAGVLKDPKPSSFVIPWFFIKHLFVPSFLQMSVLLTGASWRTDLVVLVVVVVRIERMSNFQQYGRMKSWDGKGRRPEKKRRKKSTGETKKSHKQEDTGALNVRKVAKGFAFPVIHVLGGSKSMLAKPWPESAWKIARCCGEKRF